MIFLVMLVYPGPKRAIERNLARILGCSPRSSAVRRARRNMYRHLAYAWADLFRFAQLPPEAARANLASIDGEDHLDRLREGGEGAILLTAHLGNWEVGGVLLGQESLPVTVVYVADQFPEAESFRSQLRTQAGVSEIRIDLESSWSSLPVLRALRNGELVAMQGDRDFDEQGIEAMLFGGSVRFPRGPFVLAHLTGAPIVPTFLTYSDDLRFEVRFEEPIRVSGERDEALAAGVSDWAAVLEAAIRRRPDQWYTFFDYWAGPTRDAGDPMEEVA